MTSTLVLPGAGFVSAGPPSPGLRGCQSPMKGFFSPMNVGGQSPSDRFFGDDVSEVHSHGQPNPFLMMPPGMLAGAATPGAAVVVIQPAGNMIMPMIPQGTDMMVMPPGANMMMVPGGNMMAMPPGANMMMVPGGNIVMMPQVAVSSSHSGPCCNAMGTIDTLGGSKARWADQDDTDEEEDDDALMPAVFDQQADATQTCPQRAMKSFQTRVQSNAHAKKGSRGVQPRPLPKLKVTKQSRNSVISRKGSVSNRCKAYERGADYGDEDDMCIDKQRTCSEQSVPSASKELSFEERHSKRALYIESLKCTEGYKARAAYRDDEGNALKEPMTPDSSDPTKSKRTWEEQCRFWRKALKGYGEIGFVRLS